MLGKKNTLGRAFRFPFVQSGWFDQSVLKWSTRVLRTGSGQNVPAHGSELLSSPAPVGQSAGIWRVVAGKMCARCLDFPFLKTGQNKARTGLLLGRQERTNGKQPQFSLVQAFASHVLMVDIVTESSHIFCRTGPRRQKLTHCKI